MPNAEHERQGQILVQCLRLAVIWPVGPAVEVVEHIGSGEPIGIYPRPLADSCSGMSIESAPDFKGDPQQFAAAIWVDTSRHGYARAQYGFDSLALLVRIGFSKVLVEIVSSCPWRCKSKPRMLKTLPPGDSPQQRVVAEKFSSCESFVSIHSLN